MIPVQHYPKASDHLRHQLQKMQAIALVSVNCLAFIASPGDVIPAPGSLDP
jgi:hypothetical protein